MHILVEHRPFTAALNLAARISPQGHIPILRHVLLSANGDLTVTATDCEMGMAWHVPCDDGAEHVTLTYWDECSPVRISRPDAMGLAWSHAQRLATLCVVMPMRL